MIAALRGEVAQLRQQVETLATRGASIRRDDRIVDGAEAEARRRRLVSRVEEVFGNREKAGRWLRKPNRALGGRVPIDLIASAEGADEVETILGRIEYGVYS